MAQDITITLGQSVQFSLPVSQGTLSDVFFSYSYGVTNYPATAGVLDNTDSTIQRYTFEASSSLTAGDYTYNFSWKLNGNAQQDISGNLIVAENIVYQPDYSKFPTQYDVLTRLKAAGITLKNDDLNTRMNFVLKDVPSEVFRRTMRQFEADKEDTYRVYDGSGTPEQETDEIISVTAVNIVGFQFQPGYTIYNPVLVQEQGKPSASIIIGQGQTPAVSASGVFSQIMSIFPAGRQNIKVIGRFGYGETIPADLWNAVCGEMASRLTSESLFVQDGRLTSWEGGDEKITLSSPNSNSIGWHETYENTVNLYKRPNGRRLRNLYPSMI